MFSIRHWNNQIQQIRPAIPPHFPAARGRRRGNIGFQTPSWWQTLVSRGRARVPETILDPLEAHPEDFFHFEPLTTTHQRPRGRHIPATVKMHDAIIRNDLDLLKELIEEKDFDPNKLTNFSLNKTNESSFPSSQSLPLHIACIYRRPDVIKTLLECGAKVDALDWAGRTPLEIVLFYWPRIPCTDGIDPKSSYGKYQSYLRDQHARSLRCMRQLIEKGANIQAKVSRAILNRRGQSFLHCTALNTLPLAAEWLLRYGADIEALDDEGRTPLITAAMLPCLKVAELLMSLGADTNAQDVRGNAPLHYLVYRGRDYLVRLALELGANPNAANDEHLTPLHVAAEIGNSNAIRILLLYGANPNSLDNRGRSALFCVLDDTANAGNSSRLGISLLLRETLYTKVTDKTGNLCKLLNHERFVHLRDTLILYTSEPPTLLKMCKVAIRKSIGLRKISGTNVDKLPLPTALKRYLFSPWCFYCRRCECYRQNHPKTIPSTIHLKIPSP